MDCPICHSPDHRVMETAGTKANTIRRRRACDRCKHRWTTCETAEPHAGHVVVDADAARAHLEALQTLFTPRS